MQRLLRWRAAGSTLGSKRIPSTTHVRRALGAALIVAGLALPSSAAALPSGFEARPLITGLTGATGIAFAPDGRAFVIEKAGKLKVAQPGASTATQLLDISDHVNSYGDRGLLGVAVDKDFASNGFVYLLYTYELNPMVPDSDSPMVSRLVRVTIDPNGTVTAPEKVLIGSYVAGKCPTATNTLDCIPSDGTSHSIGSVRVAPDGTLYVGSGDAADFNVVDPLAYRTYDDQSYAGKILHVDRDGRGLPGHSFCPADTNLDHVCTKVHAKGFRNPFRFQLRPSGGLAVGDVGWNTWEEVDLIDSAGGNYGWPCYEAHTRTPGYSARSECTPEYAKEGTPNADRAPAWKYDRKLGSAVIGGPTYTGTQYPDGYRNTIFVGDYTGNFVKRLVLDAKGQVTSVEDFHDDWIGTALELAPDGDLVSVNYGTGAPGDGFVEEYVYTPGNRSPAAQLSATPTSGAAPLTVKFSASGSSDPDGDPLGYSWSFGDGATATGASAQHIYSQPGTYTATLTVSDGRGLSATKSVQISPGGDPPTVSIDAPVAGGPYRDGDAVQLRGSAQDPQDGALKGGSLHWIVRLHHADHIHPLADLFGEQASFVAARDHDADSHYEIRLIATDSNGLTASSTIEIHPQTTDLRLESLPEGAPLSYGGRDGVAPWTLSSAIGYDTTVSAQERFSSGGHSYQFDHWSNGGARVHDLVVPETASTLRAIYLEDFAAGEQTSASSTEAAGFESAKAVDGDLLTRWSSSVGDNPWWEVNLGAEQQITRVDVDWEAAYARSYRILTSLDGIDFTEAATDTASGPGTRVTPLTARAARYVRVEVLERANPGWGVSAYEVRVLGPVDEPLPPPDEPPPGVRPRDAPPPEPGPIGGDTPQPKPPSDSSRPRVQGLTLSKLRHRRVIGFRLSERAAVQLRLSRLLRGRWRVVKLIRRDLAAGRVQIGLPRSLKDGRYRVGLTATDRAGNSTRLPVALRFRV